MRKDDASLVVIAMGGNSLIRDPQHMTVLDQYRAAGETCREIATIVAEGYRVLIVHGNGPQVGFIMLRSEMARDVLHEVPLENCVADTQGSIGYQIEQVLRNEFARRGLGHEVATLVTQVVVDANDPAFDRPAKPIGPFLDRPTAERHAREDGWAIAEDAGRGWRRLVPSPMPVEIVEEPIIRSLLEGGMVVIAAGGGGIPVVRRSDGTLVGRPAVIDKDAASRLLALRLGAHAMIMSTGVEQVCLDYGTPRERPIARMNVREARTYLDEGHFAPGSMRPKIEAAIAFLEGGGERVIVTQPHHLDGALHGIRGTHIIP